MDTTALVANSTVRLSPGWTWASPSPSRSRSLTACGRLGVSPERTLMVGNNRVADSGSICVGCRCLILPPVPPGATRACGPPPTSRGSAGPNSQVRQGLHWGKRAYQPGLARDRYRPATR